MTTLERLMNEHNYPDERCVTMAECLGECRTCHIEGCKHRHTASSELFYSTDTKLSILKDELKTLSELPGCETKFCCDTVANTIEAMARNTVATIDYRNVWFIVGWDPDFNTFALRAAQTDTIDKHPEIPTTHITRALLDWYKEECMDY